MKFIIFFLLIGFSYPSYSFEKNIVCADFDACDFKSSESAIEFESESTKLGFITTSFSGRALKFSISGKLNQSKVENVEVMIPVGGLSTDLSGRDDKMWTEILNYKEYPKMVITFDSIEHGYSGPVKAMITIQGKKYPLEVSLQTSYEDNALKVEGKGSFSLKELALPDPSIVIAKVRDRFDFKFKALIK